MMNRVMVPRRVLWIVACAAMTLVSVSASAQLPKPKPKPTPRPEASTAKPLPGVILVTVDVSCAVSVDGQAPVKYAAGASKPIRVSFGKHLVRAVSDQGAIAFESAVEVKDAAQQLVSVQLKGRVEQTMWLQAQQPMLGGANAGGPVILVVDPALEPAVQPHVASLSAAGVEIAPDVSVKDGGTQPAGRMRVVLQEQSHRSGAQTEVAGVKMDTCSVTLSLVVWSQLDPKTSSVEDTGAGVGDAAACMAARRKAVTSALATLVKTVRKDK